MHSSPPDCTTPVVFYYSPHFERLLRILLQFAIANRLQHMDLLAQLESCVANARQPVFWRRPQVRSVERESACRPLRVDHFRIYSLLHCGLDSAAELVLFRFSIGLPRIEVSRRRVPTDALSWNRLVLIPRGGRRWRLNT